MRSVVVALKLAEIQILEDKYKQPPLLLLDDVLSELDLEHQQAVLKLTTTCQTFLTSTKRETNLIDTVNKSLFYRVQTGQFIQERP